MDVLDDETSLVHDETAGVSGQLLPLDGGVQCRIYFLHIFFFVFSKDYLFCLNLKWDRNGFENIN